LDYAVGENVRYKDSILFVPFTTVDEYLHDLEVICKEIQKIGSRALIYLAAAVSDFYIREEKLPTHKMQSNEGDVQLSLSVVKKMLDRLVETIVPEAYVISFKLETNPDILVPKSQKALERYGHNLVIGNLLSTRKTKVVFVTKDSIENLELTPEQIGQGIEIERLIIEKLTVNHKSFISSNK